VNNDDELTCIMWGVRNRSIFSRLVVDEPGSVQRFTWHEKIAKWDVFWCAPTDQCDINYGRCEAYGKCDPYDAYNFECTCLPGYQPKSISEEFVPAQPTQFGSESLHGAMPEELFLHSLRKFSCDK